MPAAVATIYVAERFTTQALAWWRGVTPPHAPEDVHDTSFGAESRSVVGRLLAEVDFARTRAHEDNPHGASAAVRGGIRRGVGHLTRQLGYPVYIVAKSSRDAREGLPGSRLPYDHKDLVTFPAAVYGEDVVPSRPHVRVFSDTFNHLSDAEVVSHLADASSIKVISTFHPTAPAGNCADTSFRFDPDLDVWHFKVPGRTYTERVRCLDNENVATLTWSTTPLRLAATAAGFVLWTAAAAPIGAWLLPAMAITAPLALASAVTPTVTISRLYTRQPTKHRRVVALVPCARVVGYRALVREWLWPSNDAHFGLDDLKPAVVGLSGTRTMAMLVHAAHEPEPYHTLALEGPFRSCVIPHDVYAAAISAFGRYRLNGYVASRTGTKPFELGAIAAYKIPPAVEVIRLINRDRAARGVEATTLVQEDVENLFSHLRAGFLATETALFLERPVSVVRYHFKECYVDPDRKRGTLRSYMDPLVERGAYMGDRTRENEEVAVQHRVVNVRSDKKIDAEFYELAGTFVALIRDHLERTGALARDEYLQVASEEEVRRRQPRPSQQSQLDDATTEDYTEDVGKAFDKMEAGRKPADMRIISPTGPHTRLIGSQICYPLADILKNLPWFMSGKNPRQVGEALVECVSRFESEAARTQLIMVVDDARTPGEMFLPAGGVLDTDYTRMDGTVNDLDRHLDELLAMSLFAPEDREFVMRALGGMRGITFTTRHGVRFEQRDSQASGSPDTSVGNTVRNAFNAWLAQRRTAGELFPELARADGDLRDRVAYASLGFYSGDDGSTPYLPVEGADEALERHMRNVTTAVGKHVKTAFYPRGTPMPFLGRYYNPWAGSPNSCADVRRQLDKFHTSIRPYDVPDAVVAREKAFSYCLTDLETPILGTVAYAVFVGASAQLGLEHEPDTPIHSDGLTWAARTMNVTSLQDRGLGVVNHEEAWMWELLDDDLCSSLPRIAEWAGLVLVDPPAWRHPPLVARCPHKTTAEGRPQHTQVAEDADGSILSAIDVDPPLADVESTKSDDKSDTSSSSPEPKKRKGKARKNGKRRAGRRAQQRRKKKRKTQTKHA